MTTVLIVDDEALAIQAIRRSINWKNLDVDRVLDAGEYESPLKLIAKLVLRPGSSLGYHTHEGEEEIIHVLSGTAAYNDDGTETRLHAGDSCICLSDHGHSIACAGEEPLTVYAVINKI